MEVYHWVYQTLQPFLFRDQTLVSWGSRRTAGGVASTPKESAIIIAAKAAAQAGRKRASLGAWSQG